jgi:hypothetical protein
VLLFFMLRSGLWRSLDADKLRFFLGWTPKLRLSRTHPLWRSFPWGGAMFSPRRAREIYEWLEYRVALYDGKAG